jgi:hypothetical protein
MRRLFLLVGLASTACSAGASVSDTSKGDAGAPTVTDAAASGTTGDDASAIPTSCGDYDAAFGQASCVLEAKGFVEDLSGAPLDNLVMTFCGEQCYGIPSDKTGAYAIGVGMFLPTEDYAVHADGRPDHAVDYHRLSANEPSVISVTMRLPALPPSTVQLPPDNGPASSVTVGDLTLLVAAGTSFDLSIEDYNVTRALRVASVPLASAPSYAAANNVDAIYAIAPSGCVPSIKLGVSLKNSAGLPAGTDVEFLVLGDDYSSNPPNVGLLAVQATGKVSEDGQTIQTNPGEGISELTWLAVRKAN